MNILAVVTGEYGRRIANNVREYGPKAWTVNQWTSPSHFPIVIDDPRDFLPGSLPASDLILALAETPGVAEILPDVCKMTGAKAVIAPVDRVEWLPKGLMNQLRGWLKEIGVTSVFPKPFCAFTETTYSIRGQRVEYDNALIAEFAAHFGKPRVTVSVDEKSRTIASVHVERDAPCGCMRYISENIPGTSVDDAEFQTGMLHHHYPCLASMGVDPDYSDTLLHVSGDISRDAIGAGVKPFREIRYMRPDGFVEK